MTDAFFCHVRAPRADIEPRPRLTPDTAPNQSDDSYAQRKEAAIQTAAEVRARRPSMQVTRKTPWFEWCAS